jgi:Acetyltransferase (GNAT) family
MITYTTSHSDKDLLDILELQKINLPNNLTGEEIQSQGFVTVLHSFEDLQKMNGIVQSIVAKENDKVIAYLLAMTQQSKSDIPILVPMFETFNKIDFLGKKISEYNYLVVGQVCVAREYRGKAVIDHCYAAYKNHFQDKYEFAITEILTKNLRSINAHKRIGFIEIHRYPAPGNEEWSIMMWDWRQ